MGNDKVVGLINSNQQLMSVYNYDSFGCLQKKLGSIQNEYLYASEAYEEESHLFYLRNDPDLGRFLSTDPEFGSKTNAQSLNPYIYVNNNPLNFIDPTGLRSAKVCAYPPGTETKDGISNIGHGFWELTYDDGTVKTIGRYRKGPRTDHDEVCPGTFTHEWPATDQQIEQIIDVVKKGPYLFVSGNCIDGVERGLEVLGVEHPSFDHFGVSSPVKTITWIESLNRLLSKLPSQL